MAKYDAVDRLMSLATDEAQPKKSGVPKSQTLVSPAADPAGNGGAEVSAAENGAAESVLEAKVSASERSLPATAHREPPAIVGSPRAEPLPDPTSALARPRVSAAERGRQLFGALRPLLPLVGGALRMVDHGAVQAVARLLPLLGGSDAASFAQPASTKAAGQQEVRGDFPAAFAALEKRHNETAEALQRSRHQVEGLEEQLRRTRESLERTVAEQGSLSHQLHLLADRSRILTAAVIVLFSLVLAELILMFILNRR